MRSGKVRHVCRLRTNDPDVFYDHAAWHVRPNPCKIRKARPPDARRALQPAKTGKAVMGSGFIICPNLLRAPEVIELQGFFFDTFFIGSSRWSCNLYW